MFWDAYLQRELTTTAAAESHARHLARVRAIEDFRPPPPDWFRTGAVERGYAVASPLLAYYAHGLVHRPDGVDPARVPLVFGTSAWIERTALRGSEDVAAEVRRAAILLDALVRAFVPALYESEDCVAEVAMFRELPALHTCRAVVIAAKLCVGMLEAELRNVAQRSPNVHHIFATLLRDVVRAIVEFDHLVRAARLGAKLPIGGSLSLARCVLRVFGWARRVPQTQETLDEYAIALIGLTVQLDASLLPDLFVTHEADVQTVRSEGEV